MSKFILLLLLVASCASDKHSLSSQDPKTIDYCLDGSKFFHSIEVKETDLQLWRKNSVFNSRGLYLKSGVLESVVKRIETITENTKSKLTNSLPASFPKDQSEEFLLNYLGFCMADRVGVFRINGTEYVTLDKIKSGGYEMEELENLFKGQTTLIKESIENAVTAYHDQSKENSDIDIDLDHAFTFPLSFTYTSMDGASKSDAQKARKEELAKHYKQVLYTIASFVTSGPIRSYLVKNTPLPPHKDRDYSEVKSKLNALLELIEGVEPLAADTKDPKIEQFGKDLSDHLYVDAFSYLDGAIIKGEPSYQYRLNQNVKSLDTRSELFILYLLWASEVEIKRSEDKNTITFNIKVDLPAILKRFKFEPISKHMEN